MKDDRPAASIEDFIVACGVGKVAEHPLLDTPEKIEQYVARMKEATRESIERNRAARLEAQRKAPFIILD